MQHAGLPHSLESFGGPRVSAGLDLGHLFQTRQTMHGRAVDPPSREMRAEAAGSAPSAGRVSAATVVCNLPCRACPPPTAVEPFGVLERDRPMAVLKQPCCMRELHALTFIFLNREMFGFSRGRHSRISAAQTSPSRSILQALLLHSTLPHF